MKTQMEELWKKYTQDKNEDHYFLMTLDMENFKTVIYYIPSYDDLCNEEIEQETKELISTTHIYKHDIRTLNRVLKNLDLNPEYTYVNPLYETLYLELLAYKFDKTLSREIICKICAFCENLSKNQKEDVFQSLSPTEKIALVGIYKTIGLEGDISISKLIKEISASRPVFNSVLAKIKNSGAAMVESRGVKGTYIKFLDKTLIYNLSTQI